MNRYLKWILISIGSLILLLYLFIFLFLNESSFTKNSIRYYVLSDNMKTKFIVNPVTEPTYWRGDLDSSIEYMNVDYCTKKDKNSLEKIFYKMGYKYKDNRLINEDRTVEIDIRQCETDNLLLSVQISEKE